MNASEFPRHLATAIVTACRLVYGDRLVSVAVFGSWARGTATPASDIDLLIVANGLPRGRFKRLGEFARIEADTDATRRGLWSTLQAEVPLSPVIKLPEEVLVGSPLFLDMTRWRVMLHDQGGWLATYLADLTARMAALGTRRVASHGGAYWDYKPSFQPGEVVEL